MMSPRARSRPRHGVVSFVCLIGFLGFATAAACAQPPSQQRTIPEWLERWEFAINIDENDAPSYFIDPIIPLHLNADHSSVVFVEPRMSHSNNESLFNTGVGVRQLTADRSWLLGGNMFWDYETGRSHYRLGWGLEALSAYAEIRSNAYLGLSQERVVDENVAGTTYERAASGFDVEAGMPVPYYSRLKVFLGYNWYDFEKFKNRYGWTLRTEYKPFPFVVIDGSVSNSTKTNLDWGMTVALRIPFGENQAMRSPVELDERAFPESDASPHLFDLVERHHEIVVERRRQLGGVNIEIRRGT